MMLAATLSKQSARVVSRMAPQAFATRSFALADTLSHKEKVEVDRYMRELEKTFIEKKRKELAEKHHHEELTEFQNVVAPAMAEVQHLLDQSGDKVSEKGLEALVNWKLGIAK